MPHPALRRALVLLAPITSAAMLVACSSAPPALNYAAPVQPEGSSGYATKPGWATQKFAVAAANPLATDAGYQVLKAGGSAIDAATGGDDDADDCDEGRTKDGERC